MLTLLADGNVLFVVGLAFRTCNVAHFYTFMINLMGMLRKMLAAVVIINCII